MNIQHPSPPEPKPSLLQRFFSHWLISWIVIPALMIFTLHYFVFSAYHVVGSSMVPTLHDSDYLIISKINRTAALVTGQDYIPSRGQIIVFEYPKQPDIDFVKRVIGVPGDRVVVRDGQIRVYNDEYPQGFNPDSGYEQAGTFTQGETDEVIPEGRVFVVGDNRTPGGSSDSREWGLLPSQNIQGNVVLRLYPFSKVRLF